MAQVPLCLVYVYVLCIIIYGWKLFDIMQLFLVANVGVVTQARGSAYIEMGQTKVISAM